MTTAHTNIYTVLSYPNPILKTISKPVDIFDTALETLVQALYNTMYQFEGVGLAAIQVGIPKRLFVLDLSSDQTQPQVFINPEILELSKESSLKSEGCLSFPGIYTKVNRAHYATIQCADLSGTVHTCKTDGLLAHCIQHEIDHLNGITFYDRLSPLRKIQIEKKLKLLAKSTTV